MLTIAADADRAGDEFAQKIVALWSDTSRDDTHVKIHQPAVTGASDWNDELVDRTKSMPSLEP